jgi:hypothetical protein
MDKNSYYALSQEERRNVAESAIEEAINKIKGENRSPTKWEAEGLSYAFGALLSKKYALALVSCIKSQAEKHEVSKPDEWWREAEDITIEQLEDALAYAKGAF